MKFYNVKVQNITKSFSSFRLYDRFWSIIYNDGRIEVNSRIVPSDFLILVFDLNEMGDFGLVIKHKNDFFKIRGICKDIIKDSSIEDDVKIFRNLCEACNYDVKTFMGLLTL